MIHSFESNFSVICGIEECQATFKNMQTWRKHIRKEHQRARIDANDASVTPGSVSLHVQHPLTFDEHVSCLLVDNIMLVVLVVELLERNI